MIALAEERRVSTNGVVLNVAVAGPALGPLVILLHGFPEVWQAWRKQIPFLAERGYCVWAPDQRGYGTSDKPEGIARYAIDVLANDVVGLIDAAGREQAILLAHDWGGAVAFRVAQQFPDKVKRLIVVNGPHLSALRRALFTNPRQLLRNWYMFYFQVPGVERALLARGSEGLVRLLRSKARPATFDDEQIAVFRRAWEEPGAMRAMLDWYRAALRSWEPSARNPRVVPPTLIIWGGRDAFLGIGVAKRSVALCEKGRLEVIEDGTHWTHIEDSEQVNAKMASFLDAAV